jgi:hypothetical protein
MQRKMKNAMENYKNYTYIFHYKENELSELLRVACGTLGFACCLVHSS